MGIVGYRQSVGFTPNPRAVKPRSRSSLNKVPCCRIWPNGEFGLSWHTKDEPLDPWQVDLAGGVSSDAKQVEALRLRLEEEFVKAVAMVTLAPWLVKSPKSSQRPETYGRQGITAYGAKVVRSGCHLLQRKYGKGRLSFLTLTLPELPQHDLRLVAEGWGDLVRQLVQSLTRILQRSGLPKSVILVTELQPRRLECGSLGCLHLHAVFVGRHARQSWVLTPQQIRRLWLRLLSNRVGYPVVSESCENVQRVEKSAENYLSKYLTKGVESVTDYAEKFGWDCVPRQWWTATAPVKTAVKRYSMNGETIGAILDEMLWEYWKSGGEANTMGFKFARPITIAATKYQDYVIGYFGKLTQESYDDLLSMSGVLKSALADFM